MADYLKSGPDYFDDENLEMSEGDSRIDSHDEMASDSEIQDEEDESFNTGSPMRREYTEIKEQMYQDKLADLKRQLKQLQDRTLPEYVKKLQKLEKNYKEREFVNGVIKKLEVEMAEQDFINEKKAAAREFEEHKDYLREQLIQELEEKQKHIESERHSMELTGDSMELKPISTRKLRRRANEPSNSGGYGPGADGKRRKPVQLSSMIFLLDESDVLDDLKIINKNKAFSMTRGGSSHGGAGQGATALSSQSVSSMSSYSSPRQSLGGGRDSGSGSGGLHFINAADIKIEDGKLFYEKRWFRRGQAIQVEQKGGDKYPAMISAIGSTALWVRKTTDNTKHKIDLKDLTKGKVFIKRRAS